MKAVDPDLRRARGAFRKDPQRDPNKPGPRRQGTRAKHRRVAEARLLALSARLESEARKLLVLNLTEKELREMRKRVDSGKSTLGVYLACESAFYDALLQVLEIKTEDTLAEGRVLARVLPGTTVG